MKLFAAELIDTGDTRPDQSVETIADVLWAFNSPELYLLFVEQRGWSDARLEAWLFDSWCRLFLR